MEKSMSLTRKLWTLPALLALTFGTVACGEGADGVDGTDGVSSEADESTPPEEQDLVPETPDGKSDTGYLSTLAVELEGTFTSELRVDVTAKTEAERLAYRDELLAGGYSVQSMLDDQIKFAKNQINASALHMNLSSSTAHVVSADLEADGNTLRIVYESTVESIVSTEELEKAGLSVQKVLAENYAAILPDRPDLMAEKVGMACLNAEATSAEAYNYFYYYDPNNEGCQAAMEAAGVKTVGARMVLRDLAGGKTVYPEYDQLVADKKIDVVVFFGAADHDWEPGKWDWGTAGRDLIERDLQNRGFKKISIPKGDGFQKKVKGITETVTVIGPEVLKDLQHDADGLFKSLVSQNEIVIYNGHSFYGSLNVLNDAAIYPGKYQIFLMSSCWSYEYYTKQIFAHNQTAEDPQGWLRADVVNDTQMGWFHNMPHVARILLTNVLRGAETGGKEGNRYYTWDRIIGQVNDFVVQSQKDRNTETHEIFGVSGVRTNVYQPR
jgi:hypothetical protein